MISRYYFKLTHYHKANPVDPDEFSVTLFSKQETAMNYWLFKSEPNAWSWEMQKAKGDAGEEWDGIRNYQARNNMRAMKIGDRGFFYHSNEGLEIVGIIEISAESAPDSTTDDERWDCVHIRAVADVPNTVSLKDAKVNPKLAKMPLVVNTRLSVQPVTKGEWIEVCRMAGLDPKSFKPV